MKILFLITGLAYGGAETETVNLALGLKKRGFDVTMVSVMTPLAFVPELTGAGIKVHTLGIDKKIKLIFSISKLLRILKNEKPDVVHAQMYHANIFSRLVRPLSSAKYYLINTIQNNYEGGFLRKLAYKATKGVPGSVSHVSRLGYENYIESGLISRKTAVFIPNSVGLSAFENVTPVALKESLNITAGTFVFLAVARLERQKDYPMMLNAVQKLQTLNKRPFVVCIAGIGSLENELKLLRENLGLDNIVHFLGLRKDIPMLLKSADCFVMSSEWEGTPLSLLEAMGAGLPAVVTEAGDNKFIVNNGVNGFISAVSNADALAENMDKVLNLSADELADMAAQSKLIAIQNFDRESIIDKWIDTYNS